MSSKALDILQQNDLKVTECRKDVLSFFITQNKAISHSDLEINVNFDRVTLYRTLKTFLEKDIIHRVPEGNGGSSKFALCVHNHSEENHSHSHHHDHQHVHFKCEVCSNTTCINDINIPKVQLPSGFKPKESFLLISGICDNCNKL